ncbi:MAG: hypothetical protein Q4A25_00350 [Candidatus Saccharibacteria bacterium]|nr:hypothetical protein [Candidatus Saccharibacteria bacterium]
MKKLLKKLILPALLLAGAIGLFATSPVFAEGENCVETSLFGTYCDDGTGSGIFFILEIILTVLTFGVGIAGTIGIVIAGIQYASARDNEQTIAKAKMRIFQIVIGMIIWATLYIALRWLLPNFGSSN